MVLILLGTVDRVVVNVSHLSIVSFNNVDLSENTNLLGRVLMLLDRDVDY